MREQDPHMRAFLKEQQKIAFLEKQIAKKKTYSRFLDIVDHNSQDALANVNARIELDKDLKDCYIEHVPMEVRKRWTGFRWPVDSNAAAETWEKNYTTCVKACNAKYERKHSNLHMKN